MYDSTSASRRRGGGFAGGFALGLLVLPLTALAVSFVGGGSLTGLVAFAALTAGAMTVPSADARRAAGVVAAILAEVVAGAGVVVWYLATHEIRFG